MSNERAAEAVLIQTLTLRMPGTKIRARIGCHAIFSSHRKPYGKAANPHLRRHRQHRARIRRKCSVSLDVAGQGATPTAAPLPAALASEEHFSDMLPKKVTS